MKVRTNQITNTILFPNDENSGSFHQRLKPKNPEKYTDKVGYVPQKISIDWTLPIRVNDFMVLTENISEEQINEALSLTGVIHLKNKNLGNLSGGELKCVFWKMIIFVGLDFLN